MATTTEKKRSARERILETAERLFYAEGIRAVGVDRIIAEAGVAKMTLYNHFPSKDDLILAALQHREATFMDRFTGWMNEAEKKRNTTRLDAFFSALKRWFESPEFRGCAFINASVELADPAHPGAQFSTAHKVRFRELLKEILQETAGSAGAKQSDAIALLVEGAIVSAVMEQSARPADVAKEAAVRLVKGMKK